MLQSHSMLCLGEIGISRSLGVALCIVAKHLMVQQGSKCWSWVVERKLPWQSQENICNRNYVMVCGPGEDGQRGERIPKGGKKGKGKAGTSQMWRDFYCQIAAFPRWILVKAKGKDGGKSQGEKPQSRHMVSRHFSCFQFWLVWTCQCVK